MDLPDDTNISAHVKVISDDPRSAKAPAFELFMADSRTMSQCTILSDHHLAIHYQGLSMIQGQVFADPDIPGYLDREEPLNQYPVKDQIGKSQIEIYPARRTK